MTAPPPSTSTTGVQTLPLKYIIPAAVVLLLVALIVVFKGEGGEKKEGGNGTIVNLADEKRVASAVGFVVIGWNTVNQTGEEKEYRYLRCYYSENEFRSLSADARNDLIELKKLWRGYKYVEFLLGESGTCFLVTPDGYALTNKHVIESYNRALKAHSKREKIKNAMKLERITPIILVFFGGEEHRARLVHVSGRYDHAILKIDGISKAPFFALSSMEKIKRGDRVTALGFPGAARAVLSEQEKAIEEVRRTTYKKIKEAFPESAFAFSQNEGKISAPADRPVGRLIQHDAVINGGNSGGPLVNSNCTVLGINTWKITEDGSQGIFFSLQMNQLKNEIDRNVPDVVWE